MTRTSITILVIIASLYLTSTSYLAFFEARRRVIVWSFEQPDSDKIMAAEHGESVTGMLKLPGEVQK